MASDPFWDRSKKCWCCKYRPDPKGPWVKVKLCDNPTPVTGSRVPKQPPREAVERQREFADIEYRVKHGLQPPPVRAKGLSTYLEAYAESHAISCKKSSNENLRRYIGFFVAFATSKGIDTVQGVTRAVCRDYLEYRLRTVKPSSLKGERGILMGAWSRAVADEIIPANPWAHARIPAKIVEAEPTFWSPGEIAAIARHCFRPWQSDLVLLMANTGMRISTALAMRWSWVDWTAGVVKIPDGVENVKTAYSFPLNPQAREILARRLDATKGSDLVFPHPTHQGVIGYQNAKQAITKAVERAKVHPGHPHDLRHSFGRALALAGVPAPVIQQRLGHTTLAMTMRYMTTNLEHSAQFVDSFGVDRDADLR